MPILKPIRAIQLNKSHPFARGMVGCWLFNEATGDRVFDSSGNGNMGTLVGDTHFVPGKFGSALNFDGAGDYVDCGNNESLNITGEMTLSAWIKPTDVVGGTREIVAKSDGHADDTQWEMRQKYNDTQFIISDEIGLQTATCLNRLFAGVWSHVVATVDSSKVMKVYVDNVLGGTEDSFGTQNITDSNVKIGARASGAYSFDGQIDYVMIFDRALTAGEVAQLYREPFSIFDYKTPFL